MHCICIYGFCLYKYPNINLYIFDYYEYFYVFQQKNCQSIARAYHEIYQKIMKIVRSILTNNQRMVYSIMIENLNFTLNFI